MNSSVLEKQRYVACVAKEHSEISPNPTKQRANPENFLSASPDEEEEWLEVADASDSEQWQRDKSNKVHASQQQPQRSNSIGFTTDGENGGNRAMFEGLEVAAASAHTPRASQRHSLALDALLALQYPQNTGQQPHDLQSHSETDDNGGNRALSGGQLFQMTQVATASMCTPRASQRHSLATGASFTPQHPLDLQSTTFHSMPLVEANQHHVATSPTSSTQEATPVAGGFQRLLSSILQRSRPQITGFQFARDLALQMSSSLRPFPKSDRIEIPSLEESLLQRLLDGEGLAIVEMVPSDGDCFYHSLAAFGTFGTAEEIKNRMCYFLCTHYELFERFFSSREEFESELKRHWEGSEFDLLICDLIPEVFGWLFAPLKIYKVDARQMKLVESTVPEGSEPQAVLLLSGQHYYPISHKPHQVGHVPARTGPQTSLVSADSFSLAPKHDHSLALAAQEHTPRATNQRPSLTSATTPFTPQLAFVPFPMQNMPAYWQQFFSAFPNMSLLYAQSTPAVQQPSNPVLLPKGGLQITVEAIQQEKPKAPMALRERKRKVDYMSEPLPTSHHEEEAEEMGQKDPTFKAPTPRIARPRKIDSQPTVILQEEADKPKNKGGRPPKKIRPLQGATKLSHERRQNPEEAAPQDSGPSAEDIVALLKSEDLFEFYPLFPISPIIGLLEGGPGDWAHNIGRRGLELGTQHNKTNCNPYADVVLKLAVCQTLSLKIICFEWGGRHFVGLDALQAANALTGQRAVTDLLCPDSYNTRMTDLRAQIAQRQEQRIQERKSKGKKERTETQSATEGKVFEFLERFVDIRNTRKKEKMNFAYDIKWMEQQIRFRLQGAVAKR